MSVVARLVEAGLTPVEAARKGALFERLGPGQHRFFVPGRIEVLGKHTDYAGGRSLLCAVERGFCLTASPRPDRLLRLRDAGRGLEAEIPIEAGLEPPSGGWELYAATVARRVARDFPGPLRGADLAFASDLPKASGLSSSSAFVVALFAALEAANDLASRSEYRAAIGGPEDLAGYLGAVENGHRFGPWSGDAGVGTFGGSEDHTAILCGRPGRLAQYTFCPVRFEREVALPDSLTFAVAASGVEAPKAGAARERYNRLSISTATILDLWRRETGRRDESLLAAATSSEDAPAAIRELLRRAEPPDFEPAFLLGRFEQFLEESVRIIPAAADALARGDLAALGSLVDRSAELARRHLDNQIPETLALAREARRLGALAASPFGAGFGGSVWALVETAQAAPFLDRWREAYRRDFREAGAGADFFATRPGPALRRL